MSEMELCYMKIFKLGKRFCYGQKTFEVFLCVNVYLSTANRCGVFVSFTASFM